MSTTVKLSLLLAVVLRDVFVSFNDLDMAGMLTRTYLLLSFLLYSIYSTLSFLSRKLDASQVH